SVKRCPRCGLTKPLSEFHLNRVRRDGHQSICKVCRAEIDHARYLRRRSSEPAPEREGRNVWALLLKVGRPCSDCATIYPPQVMQWDHRPGTLKVGTIGGDLRGGPRKAIRDEIEKC